MCSTYDPIVICVISPADGVNQWPKLNVVKGGLPCSERVLLENCMIYPAGNNWTGMIGRRMFAAGGLVLGGCEYGFAEMSLVRSSLDFAGRSGTLWNALCLWPTVVDMTKAWRGGLFSTKESLLKCFPVLELDGGDVLPIATSAKHELVKDSFIRRGRNWLWGLTGATKYQVHVDYTDSSEVEAAALELIESRRFSSVRVGNPELLDLCELIVVPIRESPTDLPTGGGRILVSHGFPS